MYMINVKCKLYITTREVRGQVMDDHRTDLPLQTFQFCRPILMQEREE